MILMTTRIRRDMRRKVKGRRPGGFSSTGSAFLLLAASWGLAFSMACRLAPVSPPVEGDSMFVNVIGSTRFAFGNQFVVEADRWFHKGVGHFRETGLNNWFTRMFESIKPRGHVHLEDEGVNEIMPWLFFATRMDPSNMEAYSLAAFFLAGEARRPDLADRVLREAQRRNPRDYRVYYERGRLALKTGRLEDAVRFFDSAIRLWPGRQDMDDGSAANDRAALLTYRGLLHEMHGDVGEAVKLYEEVLRIFPTRHGLSERLKELEIHGRATASPADIWKMTLFHHPQVCEHDDEQ